MVIDYLLRTVLCFEIYWSRDLSLFNTRCCKNFGTAISIVSRGQTAVVEQGVIASSIVESRSEPYEHHSNQPNTIKYSFLHLWDNKEAKFYPYI